jgi:hypothetical protein
MMAPELQVKMHLKTQSDAQSESTVPARRPDRDRDGHWHMQIAIMT